jgi:hypothetical protein
MTPALERRKYFTVVVHHSAEIDSIGAFRNGATAIEFSENKPAALGKWNTWLTVQFEVGSTIPALESPKYFAVVVHYRTEIDVIGVLRNEIEFSGVNGSKSLHNLVHFDLQITSREHDLGT